MTIMVAVPDSPEGSAALSAAADEAAKWGTDLVVVNLKLGSLDVSGVTDGVSTTVVERSPGLGPAECVLKALSDHPDVDRLVIGVKRRTPVGKAVLGSISQQLLLEADVPVLAVKLPG